ncbi:MAG: hypothetical protein SGI74_12900 [Oligoflexia bacterium]|nr:hypothetical protein [Oligoflexia bacterium]
MGIRVFGEWLKTGDFTGSPQVFSPVLFHDEGVEPFILRGLKTFMILYNDPVFTSLEMRIYSDNGGRPGGLVYTSTNVQIKSAITTLANAFKEIWFDFDQLPALPRDETFYFVLWANGYTGIETSHIAWQRAWPNPIQRSSHLNLDGKFLSRFPYQVAIIGGDF